MDVTEVLARKRQAQSQILQIIGEFEEVTGFKIESVNIETVSLTEMGMKTKIINTGLDLVVRF